MPKIGVLPISLRTLAGLRLERLGIAGTVREEDAVGFEREHVFGGRQRGHHRDAASRLHEPAQDVVLDAEIVGDDVIAAARPAAPRSFRGRAGSTPARATRSASAWRRAWPDRDRSSTGWLAPFRPASAASRPMRGEDAAHHAASPQMADQRARVDVADDRECRPSRGSRRPSASERQLLASGENSRTTRPSMNGLRSLVVRLVRAVVADLRIGEDDDLAGIGRIGENFLISGDGGIEDNFAGPFRARTKTPALEDCSVFQGEDR